MSGSTDMRLAFDREPGDGPLMANYLFHPDDTASMALYADHVYCFGCNTYKWPDQFAVALDGSPLETRRSTARKRSPALKYIPDAMVETYHKWLMDPFRERME
jgi:hypothetical protein